ncbi:hypothetical protein [Puia dinghuensis]|nr:hypothetical protein [Puia dinghuensis]
MTIATLYRSLLVCAVYTIFLASASAQTSSDQIALPQPIPPSPTAAALGKYGDIPVSKYTGVPDITVPLWQITEGDIHVPISLSYHATGLKVEEQASWVGLGWSLNAGGVITRAVRGKPDEFGYLFNGQGVSNQENAIPALLLDPVDLGPNAAICDVAAACQFAKNVTDGSYDSEPDLYYYNFNGHSGKFVLDQNGNAYTIPFENIRIQATLGTSGITAWTVTMADGTQYTFGGSGAVDNTMVSNLVFGAYAGNEKDGSGSTHQPPYNSSWYLSTIQSPTGHQVSFTYASENFVNQSGQTQCLEWDMSTATAFDPAGLMSVSGARIFTYGYRLAHISFSNGSIDFIATKVRADMGDANDANSGPTAAMALEKIVINNSGGPIRNFIFNTDYFVCPDVGAAYLMQRLRLNSVTEQSGDGTISKPPYTFTYDNTHPIPSKLSSSQDHWGYYNGKVNVDAGNNPTLVPYFQSQQIFVITQRYFAYPVTPGSTTPLSITWYNGGLANLLYAGADRTPDFNYAKTAMLTQINYPTGGYTAFEYEAHDYDLKSGNYVTNPDGSVKYNGTLGGIRIRTISDYSNLSSPVIHRYVYKMMENSKLSSGTILDLPLYFDAGWKQTAIYNSGDIFYDKTAGLYLPHFLVNIITKTMQLTSGSKYELGATNGSLVGYKEVQEQFCTDNTCSVLPMGYKLYRYTSPDDYADVNSSQAYGYCFLGDGAAPCTASTTAWNQSTWGFRWTAAADITPTNHAYPYPPASNLDWKRGLLTSEEYYDATNNTVPRKKVECFYNPVTDGNNRKVISGLKIVHYFTGRPQDMYFGRYDVVAGWNYKATDKVTETDANGNQIVTTTNYFYDNPSTALLTRTEVLNSKGETLRTAYQYPPDNASTSPYDAMVARHQIDPIIQQTSTNLTTNTFLEQLNNNYFNWGNNIIEPQTVTTSNIANTTPQTRLHYYAYDNLGSVQDVSKQDGYHMSYIYDYAKDYPVAKVTNASPADIAYCSFEADGTGGWGIASTAGYVADPTSPTGNNAYNMGSDIRIAKTGLTSTTSYIVSYWMKNSTGPLGVTDGTNYLSSNSVSQGPTINGWTYYQHTITGTTTIQFVGTSLIDELRLYPAGAQMTTYTYNPFIGMTSSCDVNNKVTYYSYDALGRLIEVRDKDHNIVRHICYNYTGQPQSCPMAVNLNVQYNECNTTFVVNLTNVSTGVLYTYNIPAIVTTAGMSLGQIPVGVYNVDIHATGGAGNTVQHAIYFDKYATYQFPVTMTLSNITIMQNTLNIAFNEDND